MPTAAETLDRVTVRLIVTAEERQAWDDLMSTWHYLKSSRMVGEQLRYVAEVNGYWVALVGWSAATLKSAPRREWIGWDRIQERQRLFLIAQNARFLILPGMAVKNLASRTLSLNTRRLSADWQEAYGHPVLVAETFVDVARFSGTCYRAAGWQEVGRTKGVARQGGDWSRHGVEKRILLKSLCPQARELLQAEALPTDSLSSLTPQEIHLTGATGLLTKLREAIPDPRKRKGRRYTLPTLLGLLLAGMLSGRNHVEHIASWARGLPERILLRFGCTLRTATGKVRTPCANSFRYLLQDLDPMALDRAVRDWLISTGFSTTGVVIAIDGKTLTGSANLGQQARKAVSMFFHEHGITIAQREVPPDTTEVPLARDMITDPDLDLTDTIITADAAHTCHETATVIVKKGATISSPSKGTNPTWRLQWPNVSKPIPRLPIAPGTMATGMAGTNTVP